MSLLSSRTWLLACVAALLVVAAAYCYRFAWASKPDFVSANGQSFVSAAPAPTAQNMPALTDMLRSADAAQAVAAAQSLSQSRSPEAVPALLTAAQDARPNVQAAAITALVRLQPQVDPAPFIQIVQTTSHPAVRAAALNLLAVKKVLQACPLMMKYLEDPDVAVRGRAYAGIHALTGRDYHFHPDDPPEKRAEAIRRMRDSVMTMDGKPGPIRGTPP